MLVRCFAVVLTMALCSPAVAQTPRIPPVQDEPAALPDVVVSGDELERLAESFVDGVAAPARGRGLARWDGEVCLGAVNFQPTTARELVDHISDIAHDIGVSLGEPGCEPNVLILGTDDGQALATALVTRDRSSFRYGYTRSNRGSRALEVFQTSEAPVRWWHISLLINTLTGNVAMRLPGGPFGDVPTTGRCLQRLGGMPFCDDVTDRIVRAIIIVDLERMPEVTFSQLADYLAVVALAQVNPETDYTAFDTVLNVLRTPDDVDGLTSWDTNYLKALYSGEAQRLDPDEQAEALVDRMRTASSD